MQSLAAIGTRLTGTVLSTVWQDVKYGARLMRRRPAFSLTVVLVLTLGIGANTALFRVVDALFFTPLLVPGTGRGLYVYQRSPEGRLFAPALGNDELDLLRGQTGAFADYAAHARLSAVALDETATPNWKRARQCRATTLLCSVSVPRSARPLGPADEDPAVPPVVVISHALWVWWFSGRSRSAWPTGSDRRPVRRRSSA